MSALLWILAYLAVGFGVAVVMVKVTSIWRGATTLWLLVALWPLALTVFVVVNAPLLIRWCARRLP